MSKTLEEWSRHYEHSELDSATWSMIEIGALLRIAQNTDQLLSLARQFRGCDLARDVRAIAKKGIVVRHEYTLHLRIAWPWAKKGRKR